MKAKQLRLRLFAITTRLRQKLWRRILLMWPNAPYRSPVAPLNWFFFDSLTSCVVQHSCCVTFAEANTNFLIRFGLQKLSFIIFFFVFVVFFLCLCFQFSDLKPFLHDILELSTCLLLLLLLPHYIFWSIRFLYESRVGTLKCEWGRHVIMLLSSTYLPMQRKNLYLLIDFEFIDFRMCAAFLRGMCICWNSS